MCSSKAHKDTRMIHECIEVKNQSSRAYSYPTLFTHVKSLPVAFPFTQFMMERSTTFNPIRFICVRCRSIIRPI